MQNHQVIRIQAPQPMRAALLVALLVLPALSGCTFLQGPVGPKDILTDDRYSTWVLEFHHTEGKGPRSTALDAVEDRMADLVRKDVIDVRPSQPLSTSRSTWTAAQIQELRGDVQEATTGGGTVVTHVLYLGGRYQEENVLGVAIGHDLVAIFPDTVSRSCRPTTGCLFNEGNIERAVLIHEMGHIIGLVERGIPMVTDRESADHPKHSSNRDSVMYWAVETTGGIAGLDRIPTRFDADDREDVCNAGGRC